jgi:hypothetical protein
VNHIRDQVKLTPLEILATAIEQDDVSKTVGEELFRAYSDFLNLLDDKKSREELDQLPAVDSRTNPTFTRVREISQAFERALDLLFFENPKLAPLTRKYGVF